MFTDEHRRIVWDQIRQHDLRAFAQWLSPELLTAAAAPGLGSVRAEDSVSGQPHVVGGGDVARAGLGYGSTPGVSATRARR